MNLLYKLGAGCCIAAMALTLGSCTLSEPDPIKGSADSMRLKAVKTMGLDILKVEYDNSGRITLIAMEDQKIEFTYSGQGNDLASVTEYGYDEYYDYDTDKTNIYLSQQAVWTNIQQNSNGYITSYDYEDTEYIGTSDGSQDIRSHETGHLTVGYDADGHMTSHTDVYTDSYGNQYSEVSYFNWGNGLLVSIPDEYLYFEYSDVENQHLQWDPFIEVLGPIMISNYFGKAPSKFIKLMDVRDDHEIYQMSYSLLDNGLINQCRRFDPDEGYSSVMNFVYEKY